MRRHRLAWRRATERRHRPNETPTSPPDDLPRQRGEPSSWITRFAALIPPWGTVLDVACGNGRHTAFLLDRGWSVVAVDRDTSGVADLTGSPGLELVQADLEAVDGNREAGLPEVLAGRRFAGVVCTNFLYRPLLPALVEAVDDGGAFLYETFAVGNERFGPPHSPEFLLRPGELRQVVAGRLEVIAYQEVEEGEPRPAVRQRIVAVNRLG